MVSKEAWMCAVDFDHEIESCVVQTYPTKERLLKERKCVRRNANHPCGIARVLVTVVERTSDSEEEA